MLPDDVLSQIAKTFAGKSPNTPFQAMITFAIPSNPNPKAEGHKIANEMRAAGLLVGMVTEPVSLRNRPGYSEMTIAYSYDGRSHLSQEIVARIQGLDDKKNAEIDKLLGGLVEQIAAMKLNPQVTELTLGAGIENETLYREMLEMLFGKDNFTIRSSYGGQNNQELYHELKIHNFDLNKFNQNPRVRRVLQLFHDKKLQEAKEKQAKLESKVREVISALARAIRENRQPDEDTWQVQIPPDNTPPYVYADGIRQAVQARFRGLSISIASNIVRAKIKMDVNDDEDLNHLLGFSTPAQMQAHQTNIRQKETDKANALLREREELVEKAIKHITDMIRENRNNNYWGYEPKLPNHVNLYDFSLVLNAALQKKYPSLKAVYGSYNSDSYKKVNGIKIEVVPNVGADHALDELRGVTPNAKVLNKNQRVELSEQDSQRVLELLDRIRERIVNELIKNPQASELVLDMHFLEQNHLVGEALRRFMGSGMIVTVREYRPDGGKFIETEIRMKNLNFSPEHGSSINEGVRKAQEAIKAQQEAAQKEMNEATGLLTKHILEQLVENPNAESVSFYWSETSHSALNAALTLLFSQRKTTYEIVSEKYGYSYLTKIVINNLDRNQFFPQASSSSAHIVIRLGKSPGQQTSATKTLSDHLDELISFLRNGEEDNYRTGVQRLLQDANIAVPEILMSALFEIDPKEGVNGNQNAIALLEGFKNSQGAAPKNK